MPVARNVWFPILVLMAVPCPPLDHAIGVLLPHGLAGERAGLAGRFSRDAGSGDVFIELLLQTAVTRIVQPRRPCTK